MGAVRNVPPRRPLSRSGLTAISILARHRVMGSQTTYTQKSEVARSIVASPFRPSS